MALANFFKSSNSNNQNKRIPIENDLATFVRHPNNDILKPIVALNDIFDYLNINLLDNND